MDNLLAEEDLNTIWSEFFAVLQEKTLMYALFGVPRLSFGLGVECGYEKSIRGTWDYDVAMILDELERLVVSPEG